MAEIKSLSELDSIVRNNIIGNNTSPQQSQQTLQQQSIDKSKILYTDFFPKNQSISFKDNLIRADLNENKYTPNNPRTTNMIGALLERVKTSSEFMAKNPLFSAEQVILHLLNVKENIVWNPFSPILVNIPFVGGGNISTTVSPARYLGTEQYLRLQDRLKSQTVDNIYNGVFGSSINKVNISGDKNKRLNLYDSKRPYTGDDETARFKVSNNKIIYNAKGFNTTLLEGIVQEFENANGDTLLTYDVNQYISDIEDGFKEKFLYTPVINTPNNPRQDIFDQEYERVAKTFYLVSNIKKTTGRSVNVDSLEEIKNPTLNDDTLFLYCGIDDNITETFTPSWSDNSYVGTSQSIPTYNNTSRSLTLELKMFADKNDAKGIGQANKGVDLISYLNKMNWIAQHCYPEYKSNSIIGRAPLLKLYLGDLFFGLNVIITSLSITWKSPWEIDGDISPIVPIFADVSLGLTVIHPSTPTNNNIFLASH